MGRTIRVCPHCHSALTRIECHHCGFVGSETDFAADRCPICRSSVAISAGAPSRPITWKEAIQVAAVALVILIVVLAVVLSQL